MEQLTIPTREGIRWHVERSIPSNGSNAKYIVLIPSGEGDCQSLLKVASILSSSYSYNTMTFDMPGFSRTTAPKEAYAKVTPELYAAQIRELLREMQISRASFFGSSSGGIAALSMVAYQPDLVECSIVHEVPFAPLPTADQLTTATDEEISATCKHIFANMFVEEDNGGRDKWAALGPEYHARLAKNYVTWVHSLFGSIEVGVQRLASDPNVFRKRPVFWTIGALNQHPIWQSNIDVAKSIGVEIDTTALQSLHFPQVTVPEKLAAWIDQCVRKVEAQQ